MQPAAFNNTAGNLMHNSVRLLHHVDGRNDNLYKRHIATVWSLSDENVRPLHVCLGTPSA